MQSPFLRGRFFGLRLFMEPPVRFALTASRLQGGCSAIELRRHIKRGQQSFDCQPRSALPVGRSLSGRYFGFSDGFHLQAPVPHRHDLDKLSGVQRLLDRRDLCRGQPAFRHNHHILCFSISSVMASNISSSDISAIGKRSPSANRPAS